MSMQHFAEESIIHSIFYVLNDNSTLAIDFFSILHWTKSCNLEATNANARAKYLPLLKIAKNIQK